MANEPVAWHYPDGKPDQCTTDKAYAEKDPAWTPMYYKHKWVSPTDKEIEEIWKIAMFADYGVGAELSNQPFVHYARAIEAKLKEKNNG
jgi:hypothetical protein